MLPTAPPVAGLDALVGLGGAVVGAAAATGVALWNQRQSARKSRRVAARVLLGEALALQAAVINARRGEQVLPDIAERTRTFRSYWRANPDEMGEFPRAVWLLVTAAVHDLLMHAKAAERESELGWSEHTDLSYRRLQESLAEFALVLNELG